MEEDDFDPFEDDWERGDFEGHPRDPEGEGFDQHEWND